jgi:hypothetical protein
MPTVRVRVGKRRDAGPCGNCTSEVEEGDIHAFVVQTFGKSDGGKTRFKGSHIHMFCLPAFLIQDYLNYSLRQRKKPKGRGPGSSPIPAEFREERRRLIRMRAHFLRRILASDDVKAIAHYKGRVVLIQRRLTECGGQPRKSMVRRSPEVKAALDRKLALTTGS